MKKFIIYLSSGFIILTGCVKQEEVDLLQKELVEIKKELAQIKETQKNTQEDLADLSKRVDNVSKVASQNSIELQKLKSFGGSEKKAEEKELEKEGEEKVKIPENPEEIYRYGLDAYYKGKIQKAREMFETFTKRFKESELYDNALFWIGQTYYAEGKYDKAIKTFDRLINECKTGKILDCNKMPTAMLKKGFAFLKMGETNKAKSVFTELIKKFPDTEEAEIAKKKLEVVE
ncbi:tol-pal system protein YbgF [Persephonella sp.]|uniref:tol-pal system protein YbgF n=1 Tax=Persephonella sp. TaxID=2060922 RepID=UPI0025E0704C|nr:tol-pal system protein YbgF [Persephonella sp.]